jgi:hypothetical protein
MSLNVSVVTWDYIACATDRRLTKLDGKILSERSNKLTQFVCATAGGFITYNGIGCDPQGITPNDWLSELTDLDRLTLTGLAKRIKAETEPRLAALARHFANNPRHSFVISAFEQGPAGLTPVLGLVSNYETLGENGFEFKARPTLSVDLYAPTSANSRGGFVVTGAFVRRKECTRLDELIKAGAAPEDILRAMVKLIRDVSYRNERKGTVGTSVHTALWRKGQGAVCKLSVVGGTDVHEGPNLITPSLKITDFFVQGVREGEQPPPTSRYDPKTRRPVIKETRCSKCGEPVPEGYRRCGVCDTPVQGL